MKKQKSADKTQTYVFKMLKIEQGKRNLEIRNGYVCMFEKNKKVVLQKKSVFVSCVECINICQSQTTFGLIFQFRNTSLPQKRTNCICETIQIRLI